MIVHIVTIFPNSFDGYLNQSILKKAIEKKLIEIDIIDLRDYAEGKHRVVDDYPFGGEAGMVMKPEPIFRCIEKIKEKNPKAKVIFLTPDGKLYNQEIVKELSKEEEIILLCGRYKGVDERVRKSLVDMEISIGNYVVSGGELPAMIVVDSVMRMLPGALGNMESAESDSFYKGLLGAPVYTRPAEFRNMKVPSILLSGNHKEIRKWKIKESIKNTLLKRPELINEANLNDEEKKIYEDLKNEGLKKS
ncbi:MAG: tRNA (guanosine(37)-N1)-methyltransferase TrmD [Candidatus Schekmanbacteria bacterium]|nr:MAG: tRNA (guanosine(37)-N1)-methyltransferase TrmD [Candidatus Schekmanbacteria bacterium]